MGAAAELWAKTRFDDEHRALLGWLPLNQHMADSARVADQLWADWLPAQIRTRVAVSNDQLLNPRSPRRRG